MEEVRLAGQQENGEDGGTRSTITPTRDFSERIFALMCQQDLSPAVPVEITFLPLRNAR
jgi:hypothetical protein